MSEDVRTEALWTSAEAAAATGGRMLGRWTASGVAIDTREMQKGDLFVALKDKRDGHDFIADAFEKGAAAVLVEKPTDLGPALVVDDTLEGLRGLARAARDRSSAHRVAITGSVGKTSVKEALANVFRRAGSTHASVRSFNNHWGVPLTLARMPRTTERAVFEIGMNHAGEIRPLSALVKPGVAVVTKIAPAHLEALGTMEAIADAKAEIFEGLEEWGAAIIPGDDPHAARLAERAGAAGAGWLVRFGTDVQAEARLLAYDSDADKGDGRADILGRVVHFRVNAGGDHWGLNAVAVLAAAYLADTPLEEAAEALAKVTPGEGRGATFTAHVGGGDIIVIDDAYNANPASMAAAIESLGRRKPKNGGRRIAALGEMKELGETSAELHRGLAFELEAAKIDQVYLSGPGMAPLWDALPESRRGSFAHNVDDVAAALEAALKPGDIVLVKGSNASRMTRVVESLKRPRG